MTGVEFGALLVAALSAGATAALKDTAADAVTSAYAALKARVSDVLGRVDDIDSLAGPPESHSGAENVAAKIRRKAEGADEGERATLGELIIQMRSVLESHDQDTSGISEQQIRFLQTEIDNTLFQNEAGGKQRIDIEKGTVTRSEFRNIGKKNT